MRPTWENTFNAMLRSDWSHMGHAQSAAKQGGYPFFLWNDRVRHSDAACTATKYLKVDLYLHMEGKSRDSL